MKKLLALLLSATLLLTLLAACGAPSEGEQTDPEPTQTTEAEEPDTGDASKDDPRNQDEIGEV